MTNTPIVCHNTDTMSRKANREKTVGISITLPHYLIEELDKIVKAKMQAGQAYYSRSLCIREAVEKSLDRADRDTFSFRTRR